MARFRDLKWDDKILIKEIYDRFGTNEFKALDISDAKVNSTGQRLSRLCDSGFLDKERERYTNRYRHIYKINSEGIRVAKAVNV